MTSTSVDISQELSRRFLQDFPVDAALQLERMSIEKIIAPLSEQPAEVLASVWSCLVPRFAAALTLALPAVLADELLTQIAPNTAVRILSQMTELQSKQILDRLDSAIQNDLSRLMSYPEGSAGRLMDTRVATYRSSMRAQEVLDSLRGTTMKTARSLYTVDDEGHAAGRVLLQDVALAEAQQTLQMLARPIRATVQAVATQEEVAELFAKHALLDLPVVDINGVILGVIVHASLLQTVQEDTSADIQAMVGASREERALSSPLFAVKKRMPWLQVNLLTAFMAAAVVGLFEETIAQVTALAILLPVVAGQSGNAGAQALAVTMRGLALREISIRHWVTVMFKEVRVGLLNGLCVALTCGLGVYIWSGSFGLVVVIGLSMVIGMTAAGFAGALVPITLVRLGQDPAQSSSIVLTTVTDIAGFFSFLGIATLLMSFL